ncbi:MULTISPECIES: ABC transporter permease [Niastella]|uniref:Transport permease protein n=1 Tax=Niastella soli TaxID=2821487 RepID=A0ABS3Z0C2_9BACT|nr:ABC transporter permease [Niastella soli]MBO9203615.1 ABC transporter permease [Niastella soli]
MSGQYNQWTAMWAICRATLRAIFKSPQAIFFSLFFPIVLIMVFGALTGGGGKAYDVAFDAKSDTTSNVYFAIKTIPAFDIHQGSEAELLDRLKKGRITALIEVKPLTANASGPKYDIHLKTTSASQRDLPAVQALLNSFVNEVTANSMPNKIATVSVEEMPGRQYRMIDFYLPGMLGFSLIGSAVFGVAFVFFTLRETLVLKRMFATPVRKTFIVLGESLARVAFQLTTSIILILFGTFFYHFTLAHGFVTFLELLVLSFLGVTVFMGFGFIISSVAKNQNVIPIYANLFMFPQYFLSGTFFPKGLLPESMQVIINYLPLTALNDAMRKVSFEGMHLLGVGKEITILIVWCLLAYSILIRIFRWE